MKNKLVLVLATVGLVIYSEPSYVKAGFKVSPYQFQVSQKIRQFKSPDEKVRVAAVESFGYLRDFSSSNALIPMLQDLSPLVRREAAMALGWCGNRSHLNSLIALLSDKEWTVSQAASVSLSNLTGMDFLFDSMAPVEKKSVQIRVWKAWVNQLEKNKIPQDCINLLDNSFNPNLALHKKVKSNHTFKAFRSSPSRLTDGEREQSAWLATPGYPKNITVDLLKIENFSCVVIHQPEIQKSLTDFAIEVSADGLRFTEVFRQKSSQEKELYVNFKAVSARYIRLVSYDSLDKSYAAAIYELEVYRESPHSYQTERGLRALGALSGKGATLEVIKVLAPYLKSNSYVVEPDRKIIVQAGIRALGRLRDPAGYAILVKFLDIKQFAHYAAEALSDFGDQRAVAELLSRFPKYAMSEKRERPRVVSRWDNPGLSPIDRMFMVPFAFAKALTRLPLNNADDLRALRKLVPILVANIPSDYDGMVIYQPQAWQLIFAYLLDKAGARQMVVDAALSELRSKKIKLPDSIESRAVQALAIHTGESSGHFNGCPIATAWLPALCRSNSDIPALLDLLKHDDGWVKISAIKALLFLEADEAREPFLQLLNNSKREADYGLFGEFKFYTSQPDGQGEYNDPGPRWRETLIIALGKLNETRAVPRLIEIVNDSKNAMEIQYAAAKALGVSATPESLKALQVVESIHPLHSVKLVAREALWRHDIAIIKHEITKAKRKNYTKQPSQASQGIIDALVFIQGEKKSKNSYQMDNWRQLYGTTDSGPTYRHGRNLMKLKPASAEGVVTSLTHFKDGYVADCEVAPDGETIIFSRREEKNPWWHIFEINVDGSGLRQLTKGPYHDVQPNYLSDGRLVFSTTRLGVRDEYHGYPATGLAVMNLDGSDIHIISLNLGRDAEPVVLADGRIGFSRLELFYARMKTEWTAQAIYPDGTHNVVLYGPEWRQFWYRYTREEGIGWVISGLRHRTLRVSQLQPFGKKQILAVTQKGLTLLGPGRESQSFVPHDQMMVVTTPYPLKDGRILCAAGKKIYSVDKHGRVRKTNRIPIDLGIYWADIKSGKLKLIYNNPNYAEFEVRPIMKRAMPKMPMGGTMTRMGGFTGKLLCSNALMSMEKRVTARGKYVRIVEAQPLVARHQTHTAGGLAWKNHTGTHARVLGTSPLAPDGSFFVEIPADRFIHIQILDSDRRVVGNETIWHYSRPGELKACIGCHEKPDMAPRGAVFVMASRKPPIKCLPYGGEFSYHAKYWNKGSLPDEGEERVRTIRAVNLLGRQ